MQVADWMESAILIIRLLGIGSLLVWNHGIKIAAVNSLWYHSFLPGLRIGPIVQVGLLSLQTLGIITTSLISSYITSSILEGPVLNYIELF